MRSHAATLRIRRYVQVHTLNSAANEALRRSRETGEPYDGVAELWWGNVGDLAAATATPEGRKAARELLEDERKFIDLPRSVIWVAEEHPVVD